MNDTSTTSQHVRHLALVGQVLVVATLMAAGAALAALLAPATQAPLLVADERAAAPDTAPGLDAVAPSPVELAR